MYHRYLSTLLQNLALAVGAVAALALPALFGAIPLWAAVAFHEGSTVLVALNSLRLLSTGPTSLVGFFLSARAGQFCWAEQLVHANMPQLAVLYISCAMQTLSLVFWTSGM